MTGVMSSQKVKILIDKGPRSDRIAENRASCRKRADFYADAKLFAIRHAQFNLMQASLAGNQPLQRVTMPLTFK